MEIVLVAYFLFFFIIGSADILSVHRETEKRDEAFQIAANGDKILITSPYRYQTKYTVQYGNPDLLDGVGWPNGIMADYYSVTKTIVE